MKSILRAVLSGVPLIAAHAVIAKATPTPESAAFFETRIRPVLAENCYTCHSDARQSGKLRLDSRAAMLAPEGRLAVVAPGDVEKSLLIRAVRYDSAIKMPPAGKLKPQQIADLEKWVRTGAEWPDAKPTQAGAPQPNWTAAQRSFWSFQPVRRPAAPAVRNTKWVRNPIDNFILSRIEKAGLAPAPQADKRTLIRRASFDLLGVPPTPSEVAAFLADRRPDAWPRLVDRMLADPRYGERWARHWLDVARYADSMDARGVGSSTDIKYAWRYRDWVVNAFNRDLPYRDFIAQQVAGDLLPASAGPNVKREGLIATGLFDLGLFGNGDADKEKVITDIWDDQVDVVSRGFMGITVSCARCHNHKFDPISTQDYYGLAGIFASTHIVKNPGPKGGVPEFLELSLSSSAEAKQRADTAARIAAAEKELVGLRQRAAAAYAARMAGETGKYLATAASYLVSGKASDDSEFARKAGLEPWAFRRWIGLMGAARYRLLTTATPNASGVAGVTAWHGANDPPSLIINSNAEPKAILTYTLPAKSVCVHPGPRAGIGIAWRSAASQRVRITGRAADADPACGDGVAWELHLRRQGVASTIASGEFPNAGAQNFTDGKGAGALSSVAVMPGDYIELAVLPKGDYSCDMTHVQLHIEPIEGAAKWDLTNDLLASPVDGGNPHAGSTGQAGVWTFYDMEGGSDPAPPSLAAPLAAWRALVNAHASDAEIQQAAARVQSGLAAAGPAAPFYPANPTEEASLEPASRSAITVATANLETARKSMPPAEEFTNGLQEGGMPESTYAGIHDLNVHIRGNYLRQGERVPRRFPIILAGEKQQPITAGSGRLELAKWLASPSHPLVNRVAVNRLWQHHFGQGIVRTANNFGFLGERPTHPELLDYLATEFGRTGSMKKLHRLIMTSSTYQQSSHPDAADLKKDPDNRLLAHASRQRLEAEAIRDNLLSVAGTLDPTMGGPAVRDFNSARRGLYVMTIRSVRNGFGPLFDAADSTSIVERRTVSIVAPQALFLMNDPFAIAQATAAAKRIAKEAGPDPARRIRAAYELLYGRPATPAEIKVGTAFLHAPLPSGPRLAAATDPDATWEAYVQSLICANEFLFVD